MKNFLINNCVAADKIFPLSDLDPQGIKDALTPRAYPRIVLSTSLAEMAMKIPDVDVVLDSGISRFTSDDEVPSSFDCLASATSIKQREGRAGRAKPGCYCRFVCKELLRDAMDVPMSSCKIPVSSCRFSYVHEDEVTLPDCACLS